MIMEENWGEQEYEKAREQTLASPTPPPPPTVKEQEEQLLQLPYYSREPEITLPTVSPSKREQQLVEGVPTKEPTPTEEKEQAPSHYHQPSREEQMGERPHSQQAGMVDNTINPTLPQSSEVVVECSIEEGMSTYMEIGDEDGLDIADGIGMVDNLESKKDGSKDGIVFVEEDQVTRGMPEHTDQDDKVMISNENEKLTVTPSMNVKNEKKLCKPDKMGVCRDHGCEIKKFMVSTKKWCDRGKGKGWGWVSKRVTKYACTFEKTARNPTQEGRLRDYCVTEPSDKYDTDGDILL